MFQPGLPTAWTGLSSHELINTQQLTYPDYVRLLRKWILLTIYEGWSVHGKPLDYETQTTIFSWSNNNKLGICRTYTGEGSLLWSPPSAVHRIDAWGKEIPGLWMISRICVTTYRVKLLHQGLVLKPKILLLK